MSDPYKMAVYRAEEEFRYRYRSVDMLPNVQAFARAHAKVTGSDWWKEYGYPSTLEISPRMFRRATTRNGQVIRVGSKGEASWSWSLLVLAHELAHVADCRGPFGAAMNSNAHGPRFTAWMLTTTEAVVGAEVAATLRAIYGAARVPVGAAPAPAPESPIIGYASMPIIGKRSPDPEFAARRAERLARASENRKAQVATNFRLSS